jgi:hypothetical protein
LGGGDDKSLTLRPWISAAHLATFSTPGLMRTSKRAERVGSEHREISRFCPKC